MTPQQFTTWLEGQQEFGMTIDQIAAALHKDRSQIFRWKKSGTSKHTDLAIAAYDAGLNPIKGDE